MKEGRELKMTELSTLKRWERNYRVGEVDAIVASIARFGFNGALRTWKGTVMAGNHALLALQTMKANGAPAPRGVVDAGGDWLVPCIDVSHLSKTEAEAFAIADNRTQERGSNDPERLAELLEELAKNDLMLDAGYEQGELEALIASLSMEGLDGAFAAEMRSHTDLHEVTFLFSAEQAEVAKSAKSRLGQAAAAAAIVEALRCQDA